MTCIVGLVHGESVWMGADACAGSIYSASAIVSPKVFKRGPLLWGYTTSFRFGQIIEHALDVPARTTQTTDDAYIFDCMEALRVVLADRGYRNEHGGEASPGGEALLGYNGCLYNVQADFSFIRRARGYDACGCGVDYALGSLHTTKDQCIEPIAKVLVALEAAEAHSPGVTGPWTVLRMGAEGSFKRVWPEPEGVTA